MSEFNPPVKKPINLSDYKQCYAKEELYNPYRVTREVEVETTFEERRAMPRGKATATKLVKMPAIFAKKGDMLYIIGDHMTIMAVMNEAGDRLGIPTDKLIIPK